MIRLASDQTDHRWIPAPESDSDRYLAGLPEVGGHHLSPREEALLRAVAYGASALAGFGGYCLSLLLARIAYGDFSGLLIPGIFPGVLSLALAKRYAAPAFRALRLGRVAVFRGAAPRMQRFDSTQRRLSSNGREPGQIIATSDGRYVLWTDVGGFGAFGVRAVPLRIAESSPEGTRELSEVERRELAALARRYAGPPPGIFVALSMVPALVLLALANAQAGGESLYLLLALLQIVSLVVVGTIRMSYIRFARRLRRDLDAGRLTDGRLGSGMVWLSGGEPAAWRKAHPTRIQEKVDPIRLEQLR